MRQSHISFSLSSSQLYLIVAELFCLSLLNLHVPELSAKLGVVVFCPVLWVEASQSRKHLIVDDRVAYHSSDHKWFVLFNHVIGSQLRHKHIEGANAPHIAQHREQDAIHASLRMRDSKLLSVCEEFRVGFDVVGAFEADMQAQLGLSLGQLVDVVEGARLLAPPPEPIVVACCQAGHKVERRVDHFYLIAGF